MRGNAATLTRWIIYINIGVAIVTNLFFFTPGPGGISEVLGFTLGGFLSGAIWQPFTSMFMHAPFIGAGVMHILFNMLTLHFVGRAVEIHLGAARLAWIYFPGGLIAVAAFAFEMILRSWWTGLPWSDQPLVGASGALCAVIGVFATLFPNTRVYVMFLPIPLKARTVLYGFIVVSLLLIGFGWAGFIAHSAHLGGIFYGMAYARWMTRRKRRPDFETSYRRVSPQQMVIWEIQSMSEDDILAEMDPILEKIGHEGIRALSFRERIILDRARQISRQA